ncbi:hypothetical protein, partial [Pseudomonas viridiflava]|uniref:hypothetical protein n=1 Tax=Pseudomonas viridiflava TaxID=33069 RepID=UPI001E437D0E
VDCIAGKPPPTKKRFLSADYVLFDKRRLAGDAFSEATYQRLNVRNRRQAASHGVCIQSDTYVLTPVLRVLRTCV